MPIVPYPVSLMSRRLAGIDRVDQSATAELAAGCCHGQASSGHAR